MSAISKSIVSGNKALEEQCVKVSEEIYTMDGAPTIVERKIIGAIIKLD